MTKKFRKLEPTSDWEDVDDMEQSGSDSIVGSILLLLAIVAGGLFVLFY